MKIIKHIIIIVSVDLYGCETWSHTIRKERRVRLFENRVLSSGMKMEEVRGYWGKKILKVEKLPDLHF
jgi:hypothetical protein